MAEVNRGKAAFKFCFWLVVSIALFAYVIHTYNSGQMIQWYYYTARSMVTPVNANGFMNATKEKPSCSVSGSRTRWTVWWRSRCPRGTGCQECEWRHFPDRNQIGKKGRPGGEKVKVTVPWQIKETKGSSTRTPSSTRHQDQSLGRGLECGHGAPPGAVTRLLAEGLTDIMGLKIGKIQHGH